MPEQIITKEKEIELLMEMADEGLQNDSPAEFSSERRPQRSISELIESSILKGYNLDEKDIKIIAVLFKSLIDGRDGMKTVDILKVAENDKKIAFWEIKRVAILKELEILEVVGNRTDNTKCAGLLRSNLRLSDKFLDKLYYPDSEKEENHNIAEPYKNNLEYLCDQFERIRILRNTTQDINRYIGRKESMSNVAKNKLMEEELINLERKITERLNKTNFTIPFEEFKKKNNLSKKEELIILTILENEIIRRDESYIDDLLDIISWSSYEKLVDRAIFNEDGKLFKGKIIEAGAVKRFNRFSIGKAIKLNEDLKLRLVEDKKKKGKKGILIKDDDIFEVIKPSTPLERVILHPKTREELYIAIEKGTGDISKILMEWGIKSNLQSCNKIRGKKNRQSVTMIFYGPPGAGKTLAANAIGYELKSELITFDCSRILSFWVGESEQNTRKIFDRYRELSKGMKNPPVLLLNEADQFLHRRINATKATDNMYNQMQNIFLEQMEKFEGILIATTNLMENMDSAFSRRFQHKIEFRRPGINERFKLWQIHIPEKTPLSDDVDLWYLSEHYELSGGQIAVVVQNVAIRAARRGDKIMMEDLINSCEEEIKGNFDEKAKLRVGF